MRMLDWPKFISEVEKPKEIAYPIQVSVYGTVRVKIVETLGYV